MTPVETQMVRVDPLAPQAAVVAWAADLIRAGRLVAFPTETVYGLGANALDSDAVAGIFEAKGRPSSDPLIVHIGTLEGLADVVPPSVAADPVVQALAAAFWPGPLTLILPRGQAIPDVVTAGLPTVAVRLPKSPFVQRLIQAARVPIAAPSANRFAHTSPTTAEHVKADLDGRISAIIDGGPCTIGVESTILDITQRPFRLLRPGGVGQAAISEALYKAGIEAAIVEVTRYAGESETVSAPGQLLKHYAPNVPLILFTGPEAAVRQTLCTEAQRRAAAGQKVGVLCLDGDFPCPETFDEAYLFSFSAVDGLQEAAHRLFDSLRALEERQVDVILTRLFPDQGLGHAVNDRLIRAAAGNVIQVA